MNAAAVVGLRWWREGWRGQVHEQLRITTILVCSMRSPRSSPTSLRTRTMNHSNSAQMRLLVLLSLVGPKVPFLIYGPYCMGHEPCDIEELRQKLQRHREGWKRWQWQAEIADESHEPNQPHVVLPSHATSPPCGHVVVDASLLSPVGLEGPSSRSCQRIMRQRPKAGHGGRPATTCGD